MDNNNLRSLLGVPLVILIAVGLAFAGSHGGARISGFPIFAIGISIAFLFQWAAFIPAYLRKTESFYDLTGSLTYITVVVVAVLLSPEADSRSLLLLGMIAIWALRLGSFLFRRIRAAGEDRRFREIKVSFSRFLLAWTLQGLWVAFSLAAALAAITAADKPDLGVFALVGFLVWALGFSIEVIADRQKSKFKANPENADKFIKSGLWSWSRHPNYFGEIVLWFGIAIIAIPTLSGWTWLTLVSPLFVIILLTRISGIPPLERRADQKWGGQPDYEAYKKATSVLIPLPPRQS